MADAKSCLSSDLLQYCSVIREKSLEEHCVKKVRFHFGRKIIIKITPSPIPFYRKHSNKTSCFQLKTLAESHINLSIPGVFLTGHAEILHLTRACFIFSRFSFPCSGNRG